MPALVTLIALICSIIASKRSLYHFQKHSIYCRLHILTKNVTIVCQKFSMVENYDTGSSEKYSEFLFVTEEDSPLKTKPFQQEKPHAFPLGRFAVIILRNVKYVCLGISLEDAQMSCFRHENMKVCFKKHLY